MLIRRKLRFIQSRFPINILIFTINLENKIRRTKTSVVLIPNGGKFLIRDDKYKLYVCRKERLILYTLGLTYRMNYLAEVYSLDNLNLDDKSVFIDCGANVGEVSVYVHTNFKSHIVAVEPEENEFECLTMNISNQVLFKGVLWNEEGTLKLFSKPDSADSSVIDFGQFVECKTVEAITLDNLVSKIPSNWRMIIKIEAEGAEPEVLQGASNAINRSEQIVIDGGPERGILKERTENKNDMILSEFGFVKTKVTSRAQKYEKTETYGF